MNRKAHDLIRIYLLQFAAVTLTLGVATVVSAQEYDLNWHTIDGGGGFSAGGGFEIEGTIGQPDAGFMSGGSFELTGGFWAGGLSALTTTWLGGSGNWIDVANWSNGVPESTSTVLIDDGNAVSSDVALNEITTISNLTIDVDDLLRLQTGCWLQFTGLDSVITNDGLIQFEGDTSVRIVGDDGLTIGGSGTIRLADAQHSILGNNSPAPLLVNGAGHTIEGAGGVGGSACNFTNQGLIQATTSTLTIRSADQLVNSGTVRALNGNTLNMFSQANNGNGVYEAVGAGSRVQFFGGSVSDGELRGIDGGLVGSDTLLELHDVSNSGFFQSQETTLFGTLNNSGEIQYRNSNINHMDLATDLTLIGGGIINNSAGGSVTSGGFKLTNVDNTFSGFGDFDTETEFATASSLAPGLSDDATTSFDFNAPSLIDGTMLIELGGIDVNFAAPDINLVNTETGTSEFAMGGLEFDQLNIFNAIIFGESALLDVQLAGGFVPEVGDFFDVLTADEFGFFGPLDTDLPVINGLTFSTEILNLFDPSTGTNRDVFRLTYGATAAVNADQFNVFRGFHIIGDLSDTFESDDSYLKFNPGITLSPTEPPVWIEFEGTLPSDSLASLELTLEASANTVGLTQTIEMFNWNTAQYVEVDSQSASLNNDSVVTVDLTGDINDYVESGTGAVKTRTGWRATGLIFVFPWTVCIDQVIWTVTE